MKTTKFQEYYHYKWVLRNHDKKWGRTKSDLFIGYCLFFHWFNDIKRIFTFKKFKRDKVGNILK